MGDSTNIDVLMAGAIAAFTIDLFVYPLDTIKTRLQSQDYLKTYSSGRGSRSSAFAVRGLYQGVGTVVVATLPAAGVFFSVYESSKAILGGAVPSGVPQPIVHSLSSGAAELSSCLVLTPAEVIKQHAQILREYGGQARGSTSMRALAMLRDAPGGATRRLWSGYTALAGRNLPFTALQFPLFEAVRARVWKAASQSTSKGVGGDGSEQHVLQTGAVNGLSAAVSGLVASFATTPTDVVKTRMMLTGDEGTQGDGRGATRRGAAFRVAMQVYREKGVPGLFRGWLLRAVWSALASGLYLGTYEGAKVWLRKDEVREAAA